MEIRRSFETMSSAAAPNSNSLNHRQMSAAVDLQSLAESQGVPHLVFTYGTLKTGQPNHRVITEKGNGGSILAATGFTQMQHPLIIGTKHNIPCMLDVPGLGHKIFGEIYLVNDRMLHELDEFEEVPMVYERVRTNVELSSLLLPPVQLKAPCPPPQYGLDPLMIIPCWVYKIKNYRPELLERPFIVNYCSSMANYTELDGNSDDDDEDFWSEILMERKQIS